MYGIRTAITKGPFLLVLSTILYVQLNIFQVQQTLSSKQDYANPIGLEKYQHLQPNMLNASSPRTHFLEILCVHAVLKFHSSTLNT
jgi:hypothetical protein